MFCCAVTVISAASCSISLVTTAQSKLVNSCLDKNKQRRQKETRSNLAPLFHVFYVANKVQCQKDGQLYLG